MSRRKDPPGKAPSGLYNEQVMLGKKGNILLCGSFSWDPKPWFSAPVPSNRCLLGLWNDLVEDQIRQRHLSQCDCIASSLGFRLSHSLNLAQVQSLDTGVPYSLSEILEHRNHIQQPRVGIQRKQGVSIYVQVPMHFAHIITSFKLKHLFQEGTMTPLFTCG